MTATVPTPTLPPTGRRGPGLALGVVMTGVLITAVDTTIVVLALPEIERALDISLGSVVWVVIGYLLVITLLATQVGRLGDMYGRVLGLGLFGLLWGITRLATAPLDATLIAYLVGGVVLLVVFVSIERTVTDPMLDLSLFRVPMMTPSLLAAMFQALANYAVLFLVIMTSRGRGDCRRSTPPCCSFRAT